MKKSLFILLFAVVSFVACSKKDADPSQAAFTTKSSGYYLTQSIAFTNTSSNAKTYSWSFGDGKTSTDQSPTHSYASQGTYSVKLTVNGSASASKTLTVFNGTASYQVSNSSSYNFPLVSFSTDASNNLIDLIDHGIINSGGISDTVYTSDAKIYIGGTFPDDSLFIAVYPHILTVYTNNILTLSDTTTIFTNSLKKKQTFGQLLHGKSRGVILSSIVQAERKAN